MDNVTQNASAFCADARFNASPSCDAKKALRSKNQQIAKVEIFKDKRIEKLQTEFSIFDGRNEFWRTQRGTSFKPRAKQGLGSKNCKIAKVEIVKEKRIGILQCRCSVFRNRNF